MADNLTIPVFIVEDGGGTPLIEYRPSVTIEGARWQLIRAIAAHPAADCRIAVGEHDTGVPYIF